MVTEKQTLIKKYLQLYKLEFSLNVNLTGKKSSNMKINLKTGENYRFVYRNANQTTFNRGVLIYGRFILDKDILSCLLLNDLSFHRRGWGKVGLLRKKIIISVIFSYINLAVYNACLFTMSRYTREKLSHIKTYS